MSASARGVLFFARDAKTRTHHSTFIAPALSHADAAQGRARQAAMVIGKLEVCWRLPWFIVRPEAKVFVQPVRLDHLARIHLPVRIPNRFELAEGLHQFRSEHFGKEFGAGLAVSVFAGKGSSIADDQIGSLLDRKSTR